MTFYGYARVSTKEQSENSLRNQLKYLKIQSKMLSYTTFKEYSEKLSGKNADRPVLLSIIQLLKKGDILGVYDNSRLGRDTEENLRIARQITDKGARLQVNGKIIDLTNPNDEMMLTIESAVSTYQRKNQNLKSRIGMDTVREKGQWIFKPTLYGWNLSGTNKKPVVKINELEAKAVKHVFTEYSKGKSVRQCTNEINAMGFRTRGGKEFNVDMVRKWLFRPIYMGVYPLKGPGKDKGYDSQTVVREELIKSVYYEPIISEELWWDLYKSYRTLKRDHASEFQYRYSYHPLSSVIKCAHCGTSFVHNIVKRRYKDTVKIHKYYKPSHCPKTCSQDKKNLRVEDVEPLFEQLFYIMFLFNDDIAEYLDLIKHEFEVTNRDLINNLSIMDSKIKENKNKVDNLYKALESGVGLEQLTSRISSLEQEIADQKKNKNELQLKISQEQANLDHLIDDYSDDAILLFRGGSESDKRKKYLEIFEYVKCSADKLIVKYLFDMVISVPLEKNTRWKVQKDFVINITRKGKYKTKLNWNSDDMELTVLEDNKNIRQMMIDKLSQLQERFLLEEWLKEK